MGKRKDPKSSWAAACGFWGSYLGDKILVICHLSFFFFYFLENKFWCLAKAMESGELGGQKLRN